MPALFAYLLAIGIFLGGGYGALNWLAAPEPMRVTAKTKQAHPRVAAPIDDTKPAPEADNTLVAEPDSRADAPSRQEAAKEVSEAKSEEALAKAPALAAQPARTEPISRMAANVAAPERLLKAEKPPHSKQVNKRSRGNALELMTLRTIQFPDGHRITQLLPYRKREQALAFQPEE